MPVIITYDLEAATTIQQNRIQSLFERFGWENLGGSSYRYPRLGANQPTEDWFNHVIPALMLFRAFLIKSGKHLGKFSLDIQSSTGYEPLTGYGSPPENSAAMKLYEPTNKQFGEKKLKAWIDSIDFPY